ncbi:NAD-dependent epimerase/dehydratase family protein [Candidatus Pelagibacter sp.]|nr:NAD-dependent epimerase/dehydratase family protein [Candidatus Pelagibacter sp.]
MRILITGGCGFVGSNLCFYLMDKLKIKNLLIETVDNLKKKSSIINLKRLKKKKIKNYKLDVSKKNSLKKLKKYDLIIDCCAEPAVEISKKKPDQVLSTNLIGTLNTIEKARNDDSKILFISTSRVYPIKDTYNYMKKKEEFDENNNLNGIKSLYGYSKITSEMLIEEYSYAFNLEYLIIRSGLITGPWQFGKVEQGLISLWIIKHIFKQKLSYIGFGGTGKQIRDVLFIEDFCELILLSIKKFKSVKNQIFCVGGGRKNKINLLELTDYCQKITKNKIKISRIKKTSNYDIPYFVAKNQKVKNLLNWRPKVNIQNTIIKTYNWINMNRKLIKRFYNE